MYLPKCVVNGQLDLKEIMYPMGIVDVFTDKADLSGITGQPQHMLSSVSSGSYFYMLKEELACYKQIIALLSICKLLQS